LNRRVIKPGNDGARAADACCLTIESELSRD
jgi:hypothetical protein